LSGNQQEVRAAGGVVWRAGTDGPEILLVHRPRYDDWSLPKGKLDPGESFEQAAVREVLEETGVAVRLGAPLDTARYRDHKGRDKVVRYWLMEVEDEGALAPNDEVDEIRWVPAADAPVLLSYLRDAELVRDAAVRLDAGR
jgi:8-oxo-dGTP diphosphatase